MLSCLLTGLKPSFVLKNPQYNHSLKGYPGAIRNNIATMMGEISHKPRTSYGEETLLDQQIKAVETVLIRYAKSIVIKGIFYENRKR